MTIWFDMDGTIADLYGVDNWLGMLLDENPAPYVQAKPLLDLGKLAALLNAVQAAGHKIGVISWLSKNSSQSYDDAVTLAKIFWLAEKLPSVRWDVVRIVPYGTPKGATCGAGLLFDDEERNRREWGEGAHTPDEILSVLAALL